MPHLYPRPTSIKQFKDDWVEVLTPFGLCQVLRINLEVRHATGVLGLMMATNIRFTHIIWSMSYGPHYIAHIISFILYFQG